MFDTNILISAALLPNTTSRKALDKTIDLGVIAASNKTIDEFIEVLFRQKFDKYFLLDNERWIIINKLEISAKLFAPDISITECRDPKDNKFLELAISANASCIITGDKDLLVLHPFRNIPLLNAIDFINHF
ncbi:MAG: putative toxin-antitoxin system toxin component, PIN family [Ginsengibacter sp.]